MSRITGNDAKGLMEAYGAVYTPQELTEEQVWEEVETWVNSLLEEGYDLSDYTWEEMYESYIEEQGRGRSSGASPGSLGYKPKPMGTETGRQLNQVFGQGNTLLGSAPRNTPAPGTRQNLRGGGSRPDPRAAARPSSSPMANLGAGYKSAELQASAAARASQLRTGRTGAGGVSMGGGNAGASVQPPTKPPTATPPPKPPTATPPPKPPTGTPPTRTATPPARPAATAPATPKPAGSPMDQWAKANPRLAQAQQIRKQGGSRAEVNKVLYNKGTAAATSTPTVVKAGFDMFDVVKGYLIGEGYADTEEAALAIMINMSEDWILSIIQ
jgi:hypothetical protein